MVVEKGPAPFSFNAKLQTLFHPPVTRLDIWVDGF